MADYPLVRDVRLFEAGDYPDKELTVTTDDLDRIIAAQRDAQIPLKIEHADTPLDGLLGYVTGFYRKGKWLWGKLCVSAEAAALAAKAECKSISVGILRDLTGLAEVSWVLHPRVESAQWFTFSQDLDAAEFERTLTDTAGAVASAVYAAHEDGDDNATWIGEVRVYPKAAVYSQGGAFYRVPWEVAEDGAVTLGTPEKVEQEWKPVSMSWERVVPERERQEEVAAAVAPPTQIIAGADPAKEATHMSEPAKITMADAAAVLDEAKAEVASGELARQMQERLAYATEADAEVSRTVAELKASNEEYRLQRADALVEEFKRKGLITRASEPIFRGIVAQKRPKTAPLQEASTVSFSAKEGEADVLMHFADAVCELLRTNGPVVNYQERLRQERESDGSRPTDEERHFMRQFNLSDEDWAKYGPGAQAQRGVH